MDRIQLEQTMRRVGLVYIVALLLQLRIDGRPVLFPFLAAAVAWLLRDLHPFVVTKDDRRTWTFMLGSAFVVTALAFASLIPAVDPSGPTAVIAILIIVGTISYVDLLRSAAMRHAWYHAEHEGQTAGQWLRVSLAVTILLICSAYLFTDPLPASEDASLTYLGRDLSMGAIVFATVIFLAAWIPAMAVLQRTSREIRACLLADEVNDDAP